MRKFSSLIIVVIAVICFIVWDISEHKQNEPAAKALQLENKKINTVSEEIVPSEIILDSENGQISIEHLRFVQMLIHQQMLRRLESLVQKVLVFAVQSICSSRKAELQSSER